MVPLANQPEEYHLQCTRCKTTCQAARYDEAVEQYYEDIRRHQPHLPVKIPPRNARNGAPKAASFLDCLRPILTDNLPPNREDARTWSAAKVKATIPQPQHHVPDLDYVESDSDTMDYMERPSGYERYTQWSAQFSGLQNRVSSVEKRIGHVIDALTDVKEINEQTNAILETKSLVEQIQQITLHQSQTFEILAALRRDIDTLMERNETRQSPVRKRLNKVPKSDPDQSVPYHISKVDANTAKQEPPGPQGETLDPNTLKSKFTARSNDVKRLQPRKNTRKPLTEEEINSWLQGESPARMKFIYFKGIQRIPLSTVRKCLLQKNIPTAPIRNISFVENDLLEVIVFSEEAANIAEALTKALPTAEYLEGYDLLQQSPMTRLSSLYRIKHVLLRTHPDMICVRGALKNMKKRLENSLAEVDTTLSLPDPANIC